MNTDIVGTVQNWIAETLVSAGVSHELSPLQAKSPSGAEISLEISRGGTHKIKITNGSGYAEGEFHTLVHSKKMAEAWPELTLAVLGDLKSADSQFNKFCECADIDWKIQPLKPATAIQGFYAEVPSRGFMSKGEKQDGALAVLLGDCQIGTTLRNSWHVSYTPKSGDLFLYGPSLEIIGFNLKEPLTQETGSALLKKLDVPDLEESPALAELSDKYETRGISGLVLGPQFIARKEEAVITLAPSAVVKQIQIDTDAPIRIKVAPQTDLFFIEIKKGALTIELDSKCSQNSLYPTSLMSLRVRQGASVTFESSDKSLHVWDLIDCTDVESEGTILPSLPQNKGSIARITGGARLMD